MTFDGLSEFENLPTQIDPQVSPLLSLPPKRGTRCSALYGKNRGPNSKHGLDVEKSVKKNNDKSVKVPIAYRIW